MIGGYARLSRDEDGQDYSSIENQMMLLEEAAKENGHRIDKWYVDDGISGYVFNRPGFNELQQDLEKDLEIVYVKDFSRIGRHNAKVLLFIEEFSYNSRRLIAVNEDYDSLKPDEDDIVGIKTWINERYVKDTSKKIRKVLNVKQKKGTLPYAKHFGYIVVNRDTITICPEDAELLRYMAKLYIEGYGYRRLAQRLEQEGYKTPSEALHERDILAGEKKPYPINSTHWTASMVKELLDDDYYVGVRRLHKRQKQVIHGPDKRVPEENQYVFYDDHDKIWDWDTWNLIQSLKRQRIKNSYRGGTQAWHRDEKKTLFPGILVCSHCGHILTPIIRERKNGTYRKYYVCSLYNSKGIRYCPKSHLIEEQDLLKDIYTVIKAASISISGILENMNMADLKKDTVSVRETREDICCRISREKQKLKEVLNQKINDLVLADDSSKDVIKETYESLQQRIIEQIGAYERQLAELDDTDFDVEESFHTIENARQFLEDLLERQLLEPADFVLLFEKIEVDERGYPRIFFRDGLSDIVAYDFEATLNAGENNLMGQMLQWIAEDDRGYTSVKFLKKHLDQNDTHRSGKAIAAYLAIFQKKGILKQNPDNRLKPYTVLKKKRELLHISEHYMELGQTGGMPEMVFEYILGKNNIDPATDLNIDQSIDFGSTAAAFSGGQGDFTVEFEPSATALEKAGEGYVVASLGVDSGYVPYTSYCTTKEYLEDNKEMIQSFTNALQKGMEYVNTHTPEEIAKVIAPQFEETDLDTIVTIVTRYHEQDTWKGNLIFEESSFDLLQNILIGAGELENPVPYDKLVDNQFAGSAAEK